MKANFCISFLHKRRQDWIGVILQQMQHQGSVHADTKNKVTPQDQIRQGSDSVQCVRPTAGGDLKMSGKHF